ncbi:MAG: hypothetical protein ACOCQD_04215, partial [archaeon]
MRNKAENLEEKLETTYDWSHSVPNAGDTILPEISEEYQDATDYLDDQNYCRKHYSSYDSSHDSGDNSSYDGTYHSTHRNGNDSNH